MYDECQIEDLLVVGIELFLGPNYTSDCWAEPSEGILKEHRCRFGPITRSTSFYVATLLRYVRHRENGGHSLGHHLCTVGTGRNGRIQKLIQGETLPKSKRCSTVVVSKKRKLLSSFFFHCRRERRKQAISALIELLVVGSTPVSVLLLAYIVVVIIRNPQIRS